MLPPGCCASAARTSAQMPSSHGARARAHHSLKLLHMLWQSLSSSLQDVVNLYVQASFPANNVADSMHVFHAYNEKGFDNVSKLRALTETEAWQLWPFKESGLTGPGQFKQFEATVFASETR